jgi:hypothetical protein
MADFFNLQAGFLGLFGEEKLGFGEVLLVSNTLQGNNLFLFLRTETHRKLLSFKESG